MIQTFLRTKTICTLGPSTSSYESISKLVDEGMNIARLNFSHGEHALHANNISIIRQIEKERSIFIGILQDLQGPKIRVGKLKNGEMQLKKHQIIKLKFGVEQTEESIIPIDYKNLASDVKKDSNILFDDGLIKMKITSISNEVVEAQVIEEGLLKSRKGVNFPDTHLNIPSITEKDTRDLLFGVSQKVDYIALSFVQSHEDIERLRGMLKSLGSSIPIIAKIEMLNAIKNIDRICEASDAIMVARGDLGVECGFSKVSAYQKQIVTASLKFAKPVIIATQMLDSMINNSRPTKAEICDIANAAFDLADATMLSGETASGKYPFLTLKTMRQILSKAEESKKLTIEIVNPVSSEDPTKILARVAAKIADIRKARAIVCLTLTGKIAQAISQNRPYTEIIAVTPRPDIARRLSLIRGVKGIQNHIFYNTDQALEEVEQLLKNQNLVQTGDLLVVTGGIPIVEMRPTNLIKLHRVS